MGLRLPANQQPSLEDLLNNMKAKDAVREMPLDIAPKGLPLAQSLAAAQVVAGVLGSIMKAKSADKARKADAATAAGNREVQIRQQGTQMQNAALQSLMSKL